MIDVLPTLILALVTSQLLVLLAVPAHAFIKKRHMAEKMAFTAFYSAPVFVAFLYCLNLIVTNDDQFCNESYGAENPIFGCHVLFGDIQAIFFVMDFAASVMLLIPAAIVLLVWLLSAPRSARRWRPRTVKRS